MALHLASNDGFKSSIPKVHDPEMNYAVLMDEYMLNKKAGLPSFITIPNEYPVLNLIEEMEKPNEEHKNVELFALAYEFFTTF